MRKLAILLVPLLVLALVIGAIGCGGDGEESTSIPTSAPTSTPQVTVWVQSMTAGWSLLPFVGPDEEVTSALSSIIDKLVVCWGFDNITKEWKMYSPDVPPFINTLDYLEHFKAYWINVDADCTWTYGY